jgi:hypothetical protein
MCASVKMYNHDFILKKNFVEESLIDYNPIHFTMIDFNNLELVENIQRNTIGYFENIQYVIAILVSLYGIYTFICGIITDRK